MPKTSLEDIERQERVLLRRRARQLTAVSTKRTIASAFVVAPFAWIALLFVPLLGLILDGIALVVTLKYLLITRSLRLALLTPISALLSTVLVGSLFSAYIERSDLVFYCMAGLSISVLITYILLVSGVTWLHYERAADEPHLHER